MAEIRKKIQTVRCEVQKKCNKKTGRNDYAGFDYFQLEDFLPTANEEFNKVGLCPIYNIEYEGERQIATLTIEDGEEKVVFKIPTAESNTGKNPIQNLGAMLTYTKRYLYLNALELSEGDVVDATIGKEEPKPKKEPVKKAKKEEKKEEIPAKEEGKEELLNDLRLAYPEEAIITICERAKVDSPEKLPPKLIENLIEQRKEIVKRKKLLMELEKPKTELEKPKTEQLNIGAEELPFY